MTTKTKVKKFETRIGKRTNVFILDTTEKVFGGLNKSDQEQPMYMTSISKVNKKETHRPDELLCSIEY